MKSKFISILLIFLSHFSMAQEDQTLDWFTYFGGNNLEFTESLEITSQNEILLAGTTQSTVGMATAGAYQATSNGGSNDAFLSKWSANGELLWSTYFGGSGIESVGDVVALSDGSIVLAGYTTSDSNIATPGAYQTEKTAPTVGFIAKFDSDGQIIWSTYLGGLGSDFISGVCEADLNGIIVTGQTLSPGMATSGAFQTEKMSVRDGFMTKFTSEGELVWYTYFGGQEDDQIYDAELNGDSNIVFVGNTLGSEGLASSGASQETGTGNSVLLGKFDLDGNRIWSTYISGEGNERYADFTIGSDNEIILTARTNSLTGISTSEAYQAENLSGFDSQFIAKYNTAGQKLWATYIGDYDIPFGYGDISYSNSSIYFSGMGTDQSQLLVIGDNPFQAQNNGANTTNENRFDAILLKLTEDGFPIWGTFFGGDQNDVANLIEPMNDGAKFVIAGMTYSSDFYANANSWQENIAGQSDSYLALMSDQTLSINTIENVRPDIQLYPNPTIGKVRIDWNIDFGVNADLRVLNSVGKVVFTVQNYNPNTILNLNISPGLYLVEISQKGETVTKKLAVR